VDKAKPFDIPKREVWEAFKRVKANQGAAGVDGQSILEFEANLAGNLYKLWNRMSSGSYLPPPVRRVDIPKADGGTRPLGIPTVADRVAQEVARRYLEPILEPLFHVDSYGYRPGKSVIDAVRTARQRCWRYDWVLDLDVRSYCGDFYLLSTRKKPAAMQRARCSRRWLNSDLAIRDLQADKAQGRGPQRRPAARHRRGTDLRRGALPFTKSCRRGPVESPVKQRQHQK